MQPEGVSTLRQAAAVELPDVHLQISDETDEHGAQGLRGSLE